MPGPNSHKATAYSRKREDEGPKSAREYAPVPVREAEVRVAYIRKQDVQEHGTIEGCRGCRVLMDPTNNHRAKHTQECRIRFRDIWNKTEEGDANVERETQRRDKAMAKKFE